jgi:hypothetical protein
MNAAGNVINLMDALCLLGAFPAWWGSGEVVAF